MKLPDKEEHVPDHWILREKRKIKGIGLLGQPVVTNHTKYKCNQCGEEYVRFPNDEDYAELKLGKSRWEWGWVRIK